MAKTEVVNNDLLTVRVNEKVGAVPRLVVDEIEDVAVEAIDSAAEVANFLEEAVESAGYTVRNHSFLIAGVGVAALAAGAFIGYKYAVRKLSKKFDADLDLEIISLKDYYARVNKDGEYETPESAVAALIEVEAADAVRTYRGESPAPIIRTESVVVERNIFTDAVVDANDFDYEAEVASRDTGAPYVISFDEFNDNELEHQQNTLTYYLRDDTLCDERDSPIDNVNVVVGDDNLVRFGHGSKDKNIVYIRNEKLGLDFEIVKSASSYVKDVLGLDDEPELRHSELRRRRQYRRDDE